MPRTTRLGLAIALGLSLPTAHAADPTTRELLARIAALEQRLAAVEAGNAAPAAAPEALDQRLRVVERRQELDAEADAAKAASAPVLALNEKGLSVKSPSGDFEVKLRGLVQGDARYFGGATSPAQTDTFMLRRVEPTLEGSWGQLLGFRINAQLAGDSATINDAYVDLKFDPRASLRAGKFKPPVGLERLQSSNATSSIELGLPSELAPGRDLGVQLQGDFAGGGLSYALGVFNGAPDGRDGTQQPDSDNRKEVAARLFAEPFKNDPGALQGLGFGVGASHGEKQRSTAAGAVKYRTPGQNTFFNYLSTVAYDGAETRVSPQAYFYRNGFGLLAEYIVARQEVVAGADRETLDNKAWQAVANVLLTGEDASFAGLARPKHPITQGGAGAWELVARYGVLDVDDDAFPLFADPAKSASKATSWSGGVNWYPVGNLKIALSYTQTGFDGGAAGGADREDEKVLFTRFQIAF